MPSRNICRTTAVNPKEEPPSGLGTDKKGDDLGPIKS